MNIEFSMFQVLKLNIQSFGQPDSNLSTKESSFTKAGGWISDVKHTRQTQDMRKHQILFCAVLLLILWTTFESENQLVAVNW